MAPVAMSEDFIQIERHLDGRDTACTQFGMCMIYEVRLGEMKYLTTMYRVPTTVHHRVEVVYRGLTQAQMLRQTFC